MKRSLVNLAALAALGERQSAGPSIFGKADLRTRLDIDRTWNAKRLAQAMTEAFTQLEAADIKTEAETVGRMREAIRLGMRGEQDMGNGSGRTFMVPPNCVPYVRATPALYGIGPLDKVYELASLTGKAQPVQCYPNPKE